MHASSLSNVQVLYNYDWKIRKKDVIRYMQVSHAIHTKQTQGLKIKQCCLPVTRVTSFIQISESCRLTVIHLRMSNCLALFFSVSELFFTFRTDTHFINVFAGTVQCMYKVNIYIYICI